MINIFAVKHEQQDRPNNRKNSQVQICLYLTIKSEMSKPIT